MARELERVLESGEDFLRRSIRSRSAREAQKRRVKRQIGEMLRRLRRALFLLVGLLAALVGYSVIVAPISFVTWLVAIPTIFLIAFVSIFWPGRRRPEPLEQAATAPNARLEDLAARAEDALIERYDQLPGRALPAADATIARLNELQSHLAEADTMLAGDAKRLICEHLPRLVDTYLALPEAARAPGSEDSRRFTESLGLVAEELDHLLEQCCRDRHLSFETQHRFIESRYKQDRRLNGG